MSNICTKYEPDTQAQLDCINCGQAFEYHGKPQLNLTVSAVLREQAAAIYGAWIAGNISTASAMLNQVPHERTAYVAFTLAVLAVNEGPHTQFAMSRFIEGVTR